MLYNPTIALFGAPLCNAPPLMRKTPMKSLLSVISLAFILTAVPAGAQQGPAGVPGALGLFPLESPKTRPQAKPAKRPVPDCRTAKDRQQCLARQNEGSQAQLACGDKKGTARSQCVRELAATYNCARSALPQQCEARHRAVAACRDKNGTPFAQCVRQQMQHAQCSKTPDPVACEQHLKAQDLCKNKLGEEHRQCLRDTLTTKP